MGCMRLVSSGGFTTGEGKWLLVRKLVFFVVGIGQARCYKPRLTVHEALDRQVLSLTLKYSHRDGI